MKRLIDFGRIVQFRNIIKDIKHSTMFTGLDKSGQPIYDRNIKAPIIYAVGSEKIHGTNAAVCYSIPDGFWVQSRKHIITPEKDNAGCAFNVENNKDVWMSLIKEFAYFNKINLNENIITIFFEWCGGNIQKKSAMSGLEKSAMIFQHFKVSPIEHSKTENSLWYQTHANGKWISTPYKNIYNIMNFITYNIRIDFESPKMSINNMIKMVEEDIEPNSPVGKEFGIEGNTGEGIVFTFMYNNSLHRFKVKGNKHSKTKVKKLKVVDEIKEKSKIEFVNYVCSSCRLEQAFQNTFGINNEICEPDVKKTGDFLRAVHKDVIKEESDVMIEKGLEPKEVNGMISNTARFWFMEQLNELEL